KKGDAYAVISQDYDNLIFKAPLLVRNLSIAGKRKRAGKFAFVNVKPEIISLKEVLAELQLTFDQLVVVAILVGTDYNPGGIKGIGPKKALALVKETPTDEIFEKVEWSKHYPDLDWKEIFSTIVNMPVTDDYQLKWKKIQENELIEFLVKKHDFNEERVLAKLEKLKQESSKLAQKGLGNFF
ncbi:flap structure-specific endonuclease, partial [Candidatus Woesearchaeota archaeon]|nr:flap structure-specific endonuclease [Candidatus Woesearchaeota archaeon]